jgi:DNA-binding transcriptional ArsR family regulator
MNNEQFQILLRFLKALADESRLKILGILANQECSVEELAVLLQLKEPTVSHHLAKLKELNLVTMRPEGNTRLYQLNNQALQSIGQEIAKPETIASLAEDVDTEAWESKVLSTYVEGDCLKEIPISRKKRLVILKWLASKFEIGVNYSENTMNEIIQQYHPDSNTLSRDLVGYQFMQIDNEIYRRFVEE